MLSIGKDFAVNWFFTVRWILKDGSAFGFQLDLDLVLVFQSDLDSVWILDLVLVFQSDLD